jgi:transcription antitermination factor NusG
LAQMPCMGEGIAYRTLSGLFRQYFDPPCLVHRAPPSHPGASKAINQPPLGAHSGMGAKPTNRLTMTAPFWCVVRVRRAPLALKYLALYGYETYYPHLRNYRVRGGRRIETRVPLFPGYAFLRIALQWYSARWAPGTMGLIMDGIGPAKVADRIIEGIWSRERDGLIDLPKPPPLRRGARVMILRGPFTGHPAGRDPAAATRRRAEGDARQEGHRSGTLTRHLPVVLVSRRTIHPTCIPSGPGRPTRAAGAPSPPLHSAFAGTTAGVPEPPP